ncbi:hypothetical protein FOS14_16510 [Skermania sp. ID1734]|uniref:hypothetical protein n=1 Tax=Skermania sp. ID1734 TaxID=2597516 RepID=UPI00117FACD3|nr:hypothetical protein [Skermania sp. ID1734]TSD96644.1 hypothetical protein FOS14_16510 [Skermania sp. ID1734]
MTNPPPGSPYGPTEQPYGWGAPPPPPPPPPEGGWQTQQQGWAPAAAEQLSPSGFGPPHRNRRRWWFVGAGVFVVVLLVVGGITAWTFLSGTSGANSPENAALDALSAVQSRDPIKFADIVASGEMNGLQDLVRSTSNKATEGGFQEGGDTGALLQGLSITTTDLHTTTEQIRDDLAKVTFTSGSVALSIDPKQANPGIRDLISPSAEATNRTLTVGDLTGKSKQGDAIAPFVMTVKVDDRWYISPLYTAGEYATEVLGVQRVDHPNPDITKYDNPGAAAKGFTEAVASVAGNHDVSQLEQMASPQVAIAIATYRPALNKLFDGAESTVSVDVNRADFNSDISGDTAKVTADQVALTVSDNDERTDVRISGNCIDTTNSEGHRDHVCGGESGPGLLDPFRYGPQFPTSLRAVRDSSGWHIDPVGTLLSFEINGLNAMTKDQVTYLVAMAGPPASLAAFARSDAQATLSQGHSVEVTLKPPFHSALGRERGVAIVDLKVTSGQAVRITDSYSDYSPVYVIEGASTVTKLYSSDRFSPTKTETVKIIELGRAGRTVKVSAE